MLQNKELRITIYRPGETEGRTFIGGLGRFYIDVAAVNPGAPSKGECQVTIHGVSLETIKQYTYLTFKNNQFDKRNKMEVFANDSLVYKGELIESYGDFTAFPNLSLKLRGVAGYAASQEITPDMVITEDMNLSIEQAFRTLANNTGYAFFNQGITGNCPDIVLSGSNLTKATQLAKALKIAISKQDEIITIYPIDGSLDENIVEVNPGTGMIGYPSPISGGIKFSTLYNPQLRLGRKVNVGTIVPLMGGIWIVKGIQTILSTSPGGDWKEEVSCSVYNQ
ncbi:MAG: baseplate hub protein [Candidatus Avelusimicrobium sp.]|uniref:baseplate hub protein n=1 Tax=Candidatus Avelusimicrobium sp. TaxID=3048833 RepID=UPI003F0AAE16